jgi:hypothetical protein
MLLEKKILMRSTLINNQQQEQRSGTVQMVTENDTVKNNVKHTLLVQLCTLLLATRIIISI